MGAHPAAALAILARRPAARPAEAREALTAALESSPSLSARDSVLAQAIHVAIARRYEDAAALAAAWNEARDSVLHTEADLYMLLPLAELVTSAARVGDTGAPAAAFRCGRSRSSQQLGSPADLVGAPAAGPASSRESCSTSPMPSSPTPAHW